jgi:hypothetical protein
MSQLNPTTAKQVRVDVYLTEGLAQQMEAECGHCLCSKTAFIRNAIAKEVSSRKAGRQQAAQHAILVGQISMEEISHAD